MRAKRVDGFRAVLKAEALIKELLVSKRQEALGPWHELFESHAQHNQVNGYPEGHPKAA